MYGAAMDAGRAQQLAIWAAWTPARRLAALGRMTATVIALRDLRLARQHPHADAAEMRRLRIAATLAASPSQAWPSES